METYCTTCCKDKREDPELLPAVERYISPRIDDVYALAQGDNKPFAIFSGKYGLLDPGYLIPWYDLRLTETSYPTIVPTLIEQIADKQITGIVFYGRGKEDPGWRPYYQALESACLDSGVQLAAGSRNTSSAN